jgi:hypothetical protein
MIPSNQFFKNKTRFRADGKKGQSLKAKEKIIETFRNPFKGGFQKYVVLEEFVGRKAMVDAGPESKVFKKGMNFYAKDMAIGTTDGSIGTALQLVSYAGYIVDKSKVTEKNKNIFEQLQSVFSKKKGNFGGGGDSTIIRDAKSNRILRTLPGNPQDWEHLQRYNNRKLVFEKK